jgi:hypothetical protein
MKIKSVKLFYNEDNELEFYHAVIDDKTWQVPNDPNNRQFAAVLEWLAEGNEPLPADEPPAT